METNDEKLKQVDALLDKINKSNKLINTLTEKNNSMESTITSILDTIPRESNPSTDKMLALIDKREGWIYKDPVTHYSEKHGRLYITYDLLFQRDTRRPWLRLYCDFISDSADKQHMKCFLNCWKIVLRPTNELKTIRDRQKIRSQYDQNFIDLR